MDQVCAEHREGNTEAGKAGTEIREQGWMFDSRFERKAVDKHLEN